MASSDKSRFTRANLVVVDVFTRMMRHILNYNVSPQSLTNMTSLSNLINLLQWHEREMLNTLNSGSYDSFDIGLVYKIIRFFKVMPAPARGWGCVPKIDDITIADDIERIRIFRNSLMHKPNPSLNQTEMNTMFSDFEEIATRFDVYLRIDRSKGYVIEVRAYLTKSIDPETEEKHKEELSRVKETYSRIIENKTINVYFGNDVQNILNDDSIEGKTTKLKVFLPGVTDPELVKQILTSMIMEIVKMNYDIVLDNIGVGSLIFFLTINGKLLRNKETFVKAFQEYLMDLIKKAKIDFASSSLVEAIITVSDPLIDHDFHKIYEDLDTKLVYEVESVRRDGNDEDENGSDEELYLNKSIERMTFKMPSTHLEPHEIEAALLEEGKKQNSEKIREELRLIIIGKTGVGKSALGNFICNESEFESRHGAGAVTNHCKHSTTIFKNRPIMVMDTPGLFDTEHDEYFVENEIRKCIAIGAPGPHAILFVMTLAERFKMEDNQAIREFLKFFGKDMLKYVLLVFTHADSLMKSGRTLEEFIAKAPQQLKDLSAACGNRYISIDSTETGPKRDTKLQELLDKIDSLSLKNFEDDNFKNTEILIEKRENEIAAEAERRLKIFKEELEQRYDKKLNETLKSASKDLAVNILQTLLPIQKKAIQRVSASRDEVRTEIENDQLQFVLGGSKLQLHKSIIQKFSQQ